MSLSVKAVFHLGKESQKYIRHFQDLRIDYVMRELRAYSAADLRLFRQKMVEQVGTFEADRLLAV